MRRYRGVIRMSLTAGVALSVIASATMTLGLATGLVPKEIFGAREIATLAVRAFIAGAAAGGLFGWLVAHRERDQTLSTLSIRRVALWGGIATGSVPLVATLAATGPTAPIGILAAATVAYGIGGSVISATMLRLARRMPRQLGEPDSRTDRLPP
jgi:hypothetical protein